jgi:ABC-type lipoprotein export system ATPase subunit
MTISNESVIQLVNVKKIFKINKEQLMLFSNLNLTIFENEFVVIKGPSGSGKSTVLMLIAGLTKCDDGIIQVYNNDLTSFNEETLTIFRSVHLGIVFQMGHLIDSLTVLENILLPVELAQRFDNSYEDRATELLTHFRLIERKNSLPLMLSGGEYQRVSIIRSLILDPPLLLIDEPTANQDELTKALIIQTLQALRHKKTIVLISHEKEIYPIADRILTPQGGELQEVDSWGA